MAELIIEKPKSRKKRNDVQSIVSSTFGGLRNRHFHNVVHLYLHGPKKRGKELGPHLGTLHLERHEIRALLESLHETQTPRQLQKLLDEAQRAHERKVRRRGR